MNSIPQSMSLIPDELRAVIGLVGQGLGIEGDSQFAPGSADLSWGKILETAQFHGVLALAYRGAAASPRVPQQATADMRKAALPGAMQSLTTQRELLRVARLYEDSGLRYLAVKGHALAAQFYDNPGDRAVGDIDFIVHRDDIKAARGTLEQCGYRPMDAIVSSRPDLIDRYERAIGAFSYQNDTLRTAFDLHTRMEHTPSLFPYSFDDMYAANETVEICGHAIRTLPPRMHLLYCAVHGAWHAWTRLKWLVDVAAILRKYPGCCTDDFLRSERLRDLDLLRPVAAALYLTHLLFGMPLPDLVAAEVERDATLRHIVSYAMNSLVRNNAVEPLMLGFEHERFRVALRSRLAHKLEVVRQSVSWKAIDVISFPLPASASFLYPVLSPLFFLARKISPPLADPYHRTISELVGEQGK